MTQNPISNADYYVQGQDIGWGTINDQHDRSCHRGYLVALSKTTTAPPGAPSEGDAYVIPSGPSGDWVGHDHEIAVYYGGWKFLGLVLVGEVFTVLDEGTAGEIVVKQDATPTYKRVADINGLSST